MNQLSNLSYTNKDFNSIYAELLQYAKDVSYRWDPTVSNESDPGVVLLKLAAIIGDKDNYNIDQNILELFPASVSQPSAARQLFEQCGYSMRHYQAATGVVNILFNGYTGDTVSDKSLNGVNYTASSNILSIDRFTMLTDANNKVVYTTTRKIESINEKSYESVEVIEGTVTKYTINNEEVITAQHVDSARRLYFTEMDIAENGIFITSENDTDDFDDWSKVDNLSTQKLGSKCFKFGLTVDGATCYVEFPEDYVDLFGNGIKITYIRTTGRRGNIAARVLKNFFAKPDDNLDITISNPLPILNGDDPETIDDAYRSYQRVKDTFETLVSLKDYTDYMVTSNRASNGYVCDRTNDIQHVSTVIETLGDSDFIASYIETDRDGNSKLNAFDLCVYALEYVASCKSTNTTESESYYRRSFKLIDPDSDTGKNIFKWDDGEDIKSLQHDFKGFEEEKILMIKNKYPLKATIIPRYKLSVTQQMEVAQNVRFALYEALKSKELTFGVAPDYDYIYDTILTSDERIKAIALEYPTYETYAVYKPEGAEELAEIRVDSGFNSSDEFDELRGTFRDEIRVRNILNGATPAYKKVDNFTYGSGQSNITSATDITSVTTSATITLSHTPTTIGENEAVIFSAPSLVEENKFSNYVKVLYNFDSEIPAGKYHTLADGEYMMFFWKASSDDTEYTYIRYDNDSASKATTFYTNVALATSNNSLNTSDCTSHSPAKLLAGSDLNSQIEALTTEVKNSGQVLTGTACITTYKTNEVVVNDPDDGTRYVYWIRNKTTQKPDGKSYYTLFDDGSSEYTLQSGEYFLYCNSEKTILHIVGEGTKLIKDENNVALTNNSNGWACTPLDYASITDITVLEKYWQTLSCLATKLTDGPEPTSYSNFFKVIEQQIIALGPGCSVGYAGTATLENNVPVSLSSSVSYKEAGSEEIKYLPNFGSATLKWSARSRLDLNVGPDKPQRLSSNHEVVVMSGTTATTITGSSSSTQAKYIQASRDIQRAGGSNIDLTQLAGFKLLDPATFITYNFTETDNTVTTATTKNHPDTLKTEITTTTGTINIQPGTYLISFRKGAAYSDRQPPISDDTYTPDYQNSDRTHFIYCVTNATNNARSIDVIGGEKTDPLVIEPYLKCDANSVSADVWEQLKIRGGSFNFDPLECAKDAKIEDPLRANSFLNAAHAYNKFTICEWQESDTVNGTDINILTTIR